MELNHLKYFYFVAKEGGFTKASRVLRVAQPAITKMVKNLERSLGVELFERSGRNVRLTKTGNDIYRKCELIFNYVEEIRTITNRSRSSITGTLTFCASEPISSYIVPNVLKILLRNHPAIYPQTIGTTAFEAIRLLSLGKVEFALLFHAPDLPDEVEVRAVFPVKHKLVVATDRISSEAVCSSFIGSREVDDVANRVYPTLAKLRKEYPEAEIKISTNSLSAHRRMVIDGLGVSILPEFMVLEDIEQKKLSCLVDSEDFRFDMKLVALRNAMFSPAAESFIQEMTRHSAFFS